MSRENNKNSNSNAPISRRKALRTGLFTTGGLLAFSQVSTADTPGTPSKEEINKAIVGRWFTSFWGETFDPNIIDELGSPEMKLQYSLHEPRYGHEDIKAFMKGFREAFPKSQFLGCC